MSKTPGDHHISTEFAAKICAECLGLLDKYDQSFFDRPLSETFSFQLQHRISQVASEFLSEHNID
jgi:hypothetical protein